MSELKNCPFCGARASIKPSDSNFKTYFAECEGECGARTDYRYTEQEAADAWNKRVLPKLEWRERHWYELQLYLGGIAVGDVLYGNDDETANWSDFIGRQNNDSATVEQAKQDCEASVRKSMWWMFWR